MWRGRQVTDTARFRQLYEAASGAALQTMTARDIAAAEAMQSLWVALPGVFTQLELAERDRAKLATIKELNERAMVHARALIAQRDGLRDAARVRVKKGHSDTCSAELGDHPCDCGHVLLLDALAAAHPNRLEPSEEPCSSK
jgi:hypothetical protein